jgi:hypothetical protein
MKNEGALCMRFLQAWRNLSVRCVLTSGKPRPGSRLPDHGRELRATLPLGQGHYRPAPRSTGPGQAIGRSGRRAPCPSSAMSSGRLFLNGLLASIAHLRFTDIISIKLLPHRTE